MQPAIVSSRQPSLPVEAMTAWQRRVLLGTLVGLAALVSVAFNYSGPSFASSEWLDWSYAMLGGLFAQASLLAVWAGWGQQPITVRAPLALGVAALLGLAAAWGDARQNVAGEGQMAFAWLVVLVTAIQTLLLLLLRRRWGWQLGESNDRVLPAPRRFAFSLWQLLLWTSGAAALLALGRCIEPRQAASLGEVAEMATSLAIAAPIIAILLLPPVISGAWFALRGRKRGWAAVWLAATLVVTTAVQFLILGAMISGPPWEAAMETAGVIIPFQAGLVTTLFVGLVVIRCCDFRLSRSDSDMAIAAAALDAQATPSWLNPQRRCQTRFIFVAAVLAIIVALLVRPAIVVEQARRENLRCESIKSEMSELGVTVGLQGEQIVFVRFQSGQPVSEQALAKLCDPRQVAIRQLDFTGALLKDKQLEQLAELSNLETLTVAGTQITDTGLLHLQCLRKLKILNLAGTRISDAGLRAIEGMGCLEELCLNQTDVTDVGLAQVQSLKGLVSLGLSGAHVTDEGLRQIQNLQNLQILLLDNTKISDAALGTLRELKSLKMVTLQGSQVSPKAAAEFYRTHPASSGTFNAAAASNSQPISSRVGGVNAYK